LARHRETGSADRILGQNRLLPTQKSEGTEIKVRVGKLGYIKKLKEPEDPEIMAILSFGKGEGFFKVQESVSHDLFFN